MCGEVVVLHDYRIDDVDAYRHKTLSFRPAITEEEKKRTALIETVDGLIDGFMKSSGGDYAKLGAAVVDYLSLLKKLE